MARCYIIKGDREPVDQVGTSMAGILHRTHCREQGGLVSWNIRKGQVNEMSDTYVECLVKAKTSLWGKFLKGLLIMLTVLLVLAAFLFPPAFIIAIVAGVGAYFVNLFTDLEYEYLYLDKELVVDKVMAKSRRKRVATYTLERMEILAPVKSYRLDNYKNRNVKVKDYSIGEELQPDRRYAMFYEGGEKILLSPSEDLIKVMKNTPSWGQHSS